MKFFLKVISFILGISLFLYCLLLAELTDFIPKSFHPEYHQLFKYFFYFISFYGFYSFTKYFLAVKVDSPSKRVAICSLIYLGGIYGLHFLDNKMNTLQEKKIFTYRFGHCSPSLGALVKNESGQKTIKSIVSNLPVTLSYAANSLFDACRVIKLNQFISKHYICKNRNEPSCYSQFLEDIHQKEPFLTSSIILNSKIMSEEILKNKRDTDTNGFFATFEILEVINWSLDTIDYSAPIETYASNFQKEKIQNYSPPSGDIDFQNGGMTKDKAIKVLKSLSDDTYSSYLLSEFQYDIGGVFKENSRPMVKSMVISTFSQLENAKSENLISHDQYGQFKSRLESLGQKQYVLPKRQPASIDLQN